MLQSMGSQRVRHDLEIKHSNRRVIEAQGLSPGAQDQPAALVHSPRAEVGRFPECVWVPGWTVSTLTNMKGQPEDELCLLLAPEHYTRASGITCPPLSNNHENQDWSINVFPGLLWVVSPLLQFKDREEQGQSLIPLSQSDSATFQKSPEIFKRQILASVESIVQSLPSEAHCLPSYTHYSALVPRWVYTSTLS